MAADERTSLRSVAGVFLRLGATAFGGPAAHVGMIHRETVRRRRWVDDRRFADDLGLTNLIPGPNSTELAMLIGREAAGLPGLVVAGLCFIGPAAAIVLALAWAYVRYGTTPSAEAVLYGVEPVVIAIVAQALYSLARGTLSGILLPLVAAAALVAYLLGVNELLVLAGAGAVSLGHRLAVTRTGRSSLAVLLPIGAADVSLERLFLLMLKIGAVLYGSGYVLLAFMRGDLVERLGWLTEAQLLDAVAVGQVTPGPLFTTATFAGYVVAGLPGALLATAGIFAPSFLFSALVGPLGPRLRARPVTAAVLDGVIAGSLGLMAGVTAQLGRHAVVDVPTALLAAVALAVLVRFELNSAWLVAGAAATGLLLGAAGWVGPTA